MNDKTSSTIEQPLGALMVDVEGLRLTAAEVKRLTHSSVGGVILFSRNYADADQVSALVQDIKRLRSPQLLIAVDQEGGRVQRFTNGFHPLPAAYDIGKVYDFNRQQGLNLAKDIGEIMAGELVNVGIDLSFAPVLDRANLNSKVIGDRGFHSHPDAIIALTRNFIVGMNNAGMAATGKHFPGHGGVLEDSHECLPVDNSSMQELAESALTPYQQLAQNLGGIMTAHVKFQQIDSALPCFSYYWLETVLRKNLNFQGAIFSDDLSMAAVKNPAGEVGGELNHRALSVRVQKALQAGCDMVLLCNDPEGVDQVLHELGEIAPAQPQRLEAMRSRKTRSGVELAVLRAKLQSLGKLPPANYTL